MQLSSCLKTDFQDAVKTVQNGPITWALWAILGLDIWTFFGFEPITIC